MMTKADLIDRISSNIDMSKSDVSRVLDTFADVATTGLKRNGEVALPGFGKLKLVKREAREGRDPRTGETLQIPAKKVVKFSAAKVLKDAVA